MQARPDEEEGWEEGRENTGRRESRAGGTRSHKDKRLLTANRCRHLRLPTDTQQDEYSAGRIGEAAVPWGGALF
ncbi:hypothetical protein AAFF_G00265510 [Aldrovandia affinis]|uniref:Uncharacterized protein n=1 Tax=Aldrovandia affinis TaxID=143900 RepID=A0AAD7RBK9_9TELE|nr:hypothetical protein AAFF_G00265510 [Aldrovandia affinis]